MQTRIANKISNTGWAIAGIGLAGSVLIANVSKLWQTQQDIKQQCSLIQKDFVKAMDAARNLPEFQSLADRKMKISFHTKIETADNGEPLKNPVPCSDILTYKPSFQ